MSDRLQRISDNAGRIYAALWGAPNPEKMVQDKTAVGFVVGIAVQIEQEVAKQTLAAFAPKPQASNCSCGKVPHDQFCFEVTRPRPQPPACTCEEVPGDHARCPIHGES